MPAHTTSTAVRPDVLEQLSAGVSALTQTEEWVSWLRVARKFHTYSFGNQILIALQCPQATQVAGYRGWQGLGRQVRAGEKAIAILAPVRRRFAAADAAEDDETHVERVVAFRGASVFDVSQTDGAALPDRPSVSRLAGEDPEGFGGRLVELAADLGYTVQRDRLRVGANGMTHFGSRRIVLSTDLRPAMVVKTMAHELGHVLLHADELTQRTMSRAQCELEAESVAFVSCAGLDVDSSAYSFGYLADWTAGLGDDRERLIQASGQRILGAARQILAAVAVATEEVDAA